MTFDHRSTPTTPYSVAIIGAGFGGIGMAIRLKLAGVDDFVVLEQASEVGGTWRDNTYPGCACDIPSHLYSFSFAPRSDWSRRYPSQEEIQQYLLDCVRRFELQRHFRFDTTVQEAGFEAAQACWQIRTTDGATLAARILVSATGALSRPHIPTLPGQDSFIGPTFHSARWNHAVPLTGKRVAVVGTGASAVQFVPQIAPQVAELHLFQRTPAWILSKHDPEYSESRRWALRHLPLARRALRVWLYWQHELRALGFVVSPRLLAGAERFARTHAKRQLGDAPVREKLTPDYRIGCKRILLSNDFYPTLTRDNVELVDTPIARIDPNGIITTDGRHRPIDVLIYATGFHATDPLGPLAVSGRDGVRLADAWCDGAQAWLGVAVAGFPNLFLLGGPNTGLGHNSIIFMLEAQIGHVMRCLRRMQQAQAATIEVREPTQARFVSALRRRMRRTVWLSGCRSWYLDGSGHNTTLWPGFSAEYWARARWGAGAYAITHTPTAQASNARRKSWLGAAKAWMADRHRP